MRGMREGGGKGGKGGKGGRGGREEKSYKSTQAGLTRVHRLTSAFVRTPCR